MRNRESAVGLTFDEPAQYRIQVLGHVHPRASENLEGLDITEDLQESGLPVTTLSGELSDQAAFVGVINALYEMHLPVLSVECGKLNLLHP